MIAIIALVMIAVVVVAIRLARKGGNHSLPSSPDPVEQIQRLAKLRDDGLLSQAEFETKRAELLGRI
ncbi:SHOCT domain-containing protein [Cryobacterium sp. PH31-L1]|nr:SHOCT domain-containing protein [Cryobacterium sp. PH31-L1]